MIAFSPGLAQGCFELLGIASRNAVTFPQISSSFSVLGSLPSERVVETAQGLKWLRASETGIAILTPSGARLQSLTGYEPMLRQALLDYIEIERPAWLQNASFGRKKVIAFAGSQVGQVFVEAGLADGTDDAVVAFWDAIAAMARGQRNDRLIAIGRQGERLTIAHEEDRTGRKPKWVAIDNNEDGYDVLSIVDTNDARPFSIEVKASTMGLAGSFHLSRNEWERAQDAENRAFHLWDIRKDRQASLAVISPIDMGYHVPSDQGAGAWEVVEISFGAFRELFAIPPFLVKCAQSPTESLMSHLLQSTFISYGSPDELFARRLYEALHTNGVRTFFFPEHGVPGQKLHRVMRDGVNQFDRVILVCSAASLSRRGVLNEIEETLQREARDGGASYLIPVRLDDSIFESGTLADRAIAQAICDRVVADFTNLEREPGKFDRSLQKLIAALKKDTPSLTNESGS